MNAGAFAPGKLLLTFIARRRGDDFVAVTKKAGARGGTVLAGATLADSRLLRSFGLADMQQDIIISLLRDETPAVLKAVREAAAADPKKFRGLAVVLDVAGIWNRADAPASPQAQIPADKAATHNGSQTMQSGHKLITVIVNSGHGEDVMTVAKQAGASGGTILNAHGTGTVDDVKFFGITLVPEKDMLLIISDAEKTPKITAAVQSMPALCKPGGGIVYVMEVAEFIVLGNEA